MNRISVYVRNEKEDPSSYYRIAQYVTKLDAEVKVRNIAPLWLFRANLNLNKRNVFQKSICYPVFFAIMALRAFYFLVLDCSSMPDKVIYSRNILPKWVPFPILILLKRLITNSQLYWDIDDNIFCYNDISSAEAEILGDFSQKIIVTNSFLASQLKPKWREKVLFLPTTDGDMRHIDIKVLNELRRSVYDKEIHLVWVGSGGNLKYVEQIINELEKTAEVLKNKYGKQLILSIVSNKSILAKCHYLYIRSVPWSRSVTIEEMCSAHVGIMPLEENEYTLGKAAFKLVQYIACGMPSIGSCVGYNTQVIDNTFGELVKQPQDWIEAIISLCVNWDTWLEMSEAAYSKWNNKFSYDYNLKFWKTLVEDTGFN